MFKAIINQSSTKSISHKNTGKFATNTVTNSLTKIFTDPLNKKIISGYGSCYKCNCRAYEGNDYTCGNCGHSYGDHY